MLWPGPVRALAPVPPFRVQIFAEPTEMDPALNRGSSSNYLFHALYRGLFVYRGDDGLRPGGARSCRRHLGSLTCVLNPNSRWSDGRPITAASYVTAFRRVVDPAVASPHADLLAAVKHARAIRRGERPASALGVHAKDPRTLVINFDAEDPEFEYKLIHPALSPYPNGGYPPVARASELVTSGAYHVAGITPATRWRLTPNSHHPGAARRPPVEMVPVDDDSTALSLFEAGKLSFLRRLVASEIPRFKRTPLFHQVPQARFDYVGFGPDLVDRPELRRALMMSVEYPQFLKLFDTRTPPGCISLPGRLVTAPACIAFDPKAKVAAAPLDFHFSRLGGEDIRRAVEWFAAQWKKNLGLEVHLRSEEQGVYLAHLRARPPAIFRKGVGLDRPTCLAAMELFEPGHPENFLRLDDADFNASVKTLRHATRDADRRVQCEVAVTRLLKTERLIPLGEMYFTLLVDPRFSGWDLSEINQLDLSRLYFDEKVGVR